MARDTASRAGRWRRGALALALGTGLGAGLGTTAAAQTLDSPAVPRVLASNGAIVIMPEIKGLKCEDMATVLRRLDLSDYRGPGPLPQGHPDYPIFLYEDRLAAAYYWRCIMATSRFDDPAAAFAFGFEPQ